MSNNIGWICPNCGMAKSPYSTECCVRQPQTFTSASTNFDAYSPTAKWITTQPPKQQDAPFDEDLTTKNQINE
jgi:hypothetical protein